MATATHADLPVSFDDIEAAARRIEGAVMRTPTLLSRPLSEALGATVHVKFENFQRTGSFKERGALNKLLLMEEGARARGVITASAGNHALALAYHAARLGVPATVVMPVQTPAIKFVEAQRHGAEIVLFGDIFDEAYAHALELSDRRGLIVVHPFDDLEVIAGQGTVAVELLADAPGVDLLVVPLGGGGLISGIGCAAKALRPEIELVGVQPLLYPSMYCRFTREQLPCAGDTIAEGIAVKAPGLLTSGIINRVVDDIVLVAERDIEAAVSLFVQAEKTVAEGAGAAALAAVLADPGRYRGRNVGLVLSGGNIDPRLLSNVLLRDLARSGRMARLRIRLPDRPGALLAVLRLFDRHRVNVVEIDHQRVFAALPAKEAFIDVDCEARDDAQLGLLIADIQEDGFEVHPIEVD